eukprot:Gb_32108 [translate_table: standard]
MGKTVSLVMDAMLSVILFAWENPIISFELLGVGILTVLYPHFCFKIFLSPVVVYTVFFLTALLSLGHRQQQQKAEAAINNSIADSSAINQVSVSRTFQEQYTVTTLHVIRTASEIVGINQEKVQDDAIPINDGELQMPNVLEEEEIKKNSTREEGIENRLLDVSDKTVLIASPNVGKMDEFEKREGECCSETQILLRGRRDIHSTKSVRFSDTETVIEDGYRRHNLDVIMEDVELEESSIEIEDSMVKPDVDDSDDEASMRLSPSPCHSPTSSQEYLDDERKVRLEDFFSLTLQSSWKSFAHHHYNYSCSDSDNSDDGADSSSSNASLGDLGPLLYEIPPTLHHCSYTYNSSQHQGTDAEQTALMHKSNIAEDIDEESPVEFRFTWTEDEGDENLFEIVHMGDAQSMSEDDNLIEIALSDQEKHPEEELKLINPGFDKAQGHTEEYKFNSSECPEEENLIEIDISAVDSILAQEEENQVEIQPVLARNESPSNIAYQKDQTQPKELAFCSSESHADQTNVEMKFTQQNELTTTTQVVGEMTECKNSGKIHPKCDETVNKIEIVGLDSSPEANMHRDDVLNTAPEPSKPVGIGKT